MAKMDLSRAKSSDVMEQLRAQGIGDLEALVEQSLRRAKEAAGKHGEQTTQVMVYVDSDKFVLVLA
ncbi:MAG TPA: hypothetical protein VK879_02640 [Candidatus Sulfomarinibacteraceae bacterium]|nr:hypothetical protein [Candidatus Sulfomarinibacteraceae bacterium]